MYDKIPCHWCFGCRVDRANMWKDRIEFDRLGRPSAFVTFTYDDNFVLFTRDGEMSLCRDDFVKFIDRLQARVRKSTNPLIQSDFGYFAVGEYGDSFGRPHYHVLFLGLDFYECRKLFYSEWKYGIIDSLPILDGGISYVLKYMDKQQNAIMAEMLYDNVGIERPFVSVSRGLGRNLYYSQLDFCKKTGSYRNLAGKVRPLPQYYKNLFLSSPDVSFKQLKEYERLFPEDKFYKGFDDYQSAQMYARERIFGDLNLQQGRAVLRVGENPVNRIGNGTVRRLMYSEHLKSELRRIEEFEEQFLAKTFGKSIA